jgi:Gas vesicle protein G
VGLITGLLLLPLAPVRGVAWVAEVVAQEAERELEAAKSPERLLGELEAARAAGELSDEEFAAAEGELIDLLIATHHEEGG